MIQEITTFIHDQALLLPTPITLTIGTDLFAGHRPQGVTDDCDVIVESAGGMVYFDLPERADPVIQVLSRALTYLTARARAWAIYDAIFRNHSPLVAPANAASAGWILPIVTAGIRYEAMIIEPLSPPQYIGQDEKLRHEFSTNYIFKIRKL